MLILLLLASCNYYSEKTYKYKLQISIYNSPIVQGDAFTYADSFNLTGPTHFKYYRDGVEYSISNNIPIEINTNTAYTGE